MAKMPHLIGDYLEGGFTTSELASFDWLVFGAGSDIRHVPKGASEDEHWLRANVQGVPKFFERARAAGIQRAAYIGSFYPQAAPHLVAGNKYVASRLAADEAIRALTTPDFAVISLNAPYVIGTVPGLIVPHLQAHAGYALGRLPQIENYSIAGGLNFISTRSLSESILGALERGEPGKGYLVGDDNVSFRDYFRAYFSAAGNNHPLPVEDREHPLFPDFTLFAGRGNTIYYEPNAAETALLGYRRHDVLPTIEEIVKFYS